MGNNKTRRGFLATLLAIPAVAAAAPVPALAPEIKKIKMSGTYGQFGDRADQPHWLQQDWGPDRDYVSVWIAEDGVVVSQSNLQKLKHHQFDTETVDFGSKAYPLNLYET